MPFPLAASGERAACACARAKRHGEILQCTRFAHNGQRAVQMHGHTCLSTTDASSGSRFKTVAVLPGLTTQPQNDIDAMLDCGHVCECLRKQASQSVGDGARGHTPRRPTTGFGKGGGCNPRPSSQGVGMGKTMEARLRALDSHDATHRFAPRRLRLGAASTCCWRCLTCGRHHNRWH